MRDWAYRQWPAVAPDTHIVIVDIGKMDRARLAALVERIGAASPAFIGIDAVFPFQRDSHQDSAWSLALCRTANLVPIALACSLDLRYPLLHAPPLRKSLNRFVGCTGMEAFANLLTRDSVRVVRECLPYTVAGRDTHWSLALAAALARDPHLRAELPTWAGPLPIRFRGNLEHFYYLNGEEVLRDSLSVGWLRDKIVFMGLADPLRQSMEDIFFSPFSAAFTERRFPDMYGVVVHANIASMFVQRWRFISVPEGWVLAVLGVWYLLLSGLVRGVKNPIGRGLVIRGLQVLTLVGAAKGLMALTVAGYWVPWLSFFAGVLIGGEMELWRLRK
ncbi:MAG: CHASE2 domain-containing protein [Bacteroidetes bacterium]|nr:MAG: CHASE2 domain-containing protein [Bacteroidota bacterium]